MDITEIKNEINRLQNSDTNWQNIERLSWLYTVHDHMINDKMIINECMPICSGDFGHVVSGKNINNLMNILSEHMSVVKILYPKEYQAVLDKIAEIQ
jgi:hypothetical protein